MNNIDIANLLEEIADYLEILNVKWKPKAYRNASLAIRNLEEDINIINKNNKLTEIPGIGEGIAKKIKEALKTNKISELEKLKKKIPINLKELRSIRGVGPKTILKLYKTLKVKNIEDLKKAILSGKVDKIEGFAEKKEHEILENINLKSSRIILGEALPQAESIVKKLRSSNFAQTIIIAGSLRRMKESIGDIDLLAISNKPKELMDYFTSLPDVKKVIVKGESKSEIVLHNNLQVDLRILKKESFGSGLQYFTGSKEHSVKLRTLALSKGFTLNEYGLYTIKNKKLVASKTEEEIYKKLGLNYIEPELREDRGEIEIASTNKKTNSPQLPNLIKLSDIKGDLHIHSNFSDGLSTIEDNVVKAESLGYEYIAITDHFGNLTVANALDENRAIKYFNEIDRLQKKYNITLLKGFEVNINRDGTLDCPPHILKQTDLVVGSIHSGFKDSTETIMKRYEVAMNNPHLKIIGHPTGRMINERISLNVDINKLIELAKKSNTALEVNSYIQRLDLNDINIKNAISHKVKISIDTDSHHANNLDYIKYGVATAKRGWATKEDVINTFSLKRLLKHIKK